jgi:hypothetical protein
MVKPWIINRSKLDMAVFEVIFACRNKYAYYGIKESENVGVHVPFYSTNPKLL